MKVYKENDKWFFSGHYDDRAVPKEAGFRWNPDKKQWWTDKRENALKLVAIAEPSTKIELETALVEAQTSLDFSRAKSSNLEIPVPEGLAYLPFQKAGIEYMLQRQNTLLGDAPGLGKTISVIGFLNLQPEIKKILVICPASLKINWQRELSKWLVMPRTIRIANGSLNLDADIVVVNYDICKKYQKELRSVVWDLLVADECHYLKNPKSLRSKAILGKTARKTEDKIPPIPAKHKLFLTGTPILNRPVELWPLIHALDPDTWKSWWQFVYRYCGAYQGPWGLDVSGATHLEELQEKLRCSVMVRRSKEEVLPDLPSKTRQIIEVSPDSKSIATLIAREQAAYSLHQETLTNLRNLRDASGSDAIYKQCAASLRDATKIAFEEIAKMRHDVAIAKVPAVIEHVQQLLEGGVEKVVIFAHHKDAIQALLEGLVGFSPVHLVGDDRLDDRQKSVDRFQTDPSVRVFIGSIMAAGVGLTLTAASTVVFAELDWVPGNITQCEDRLHRISQTDNVLVQHLVIDGSLDAHIVKTLVHKQDIADRALDKGVDTISRINILDLVDDVEEKRNPEPMVTQEQKNAIHLGLQILAGVCDGAAQKDDKGFNRFDARLGHDLAKTKNLTNRQTVVGARLIVKYQKQLNDENMLRLAKEILCLSNAPQL